MYIYTCTHTRKHAHKHRYKACLSEGAEAADLALTLTRTPLLLVCAWSARKKKMRMHGRRK